MTDTLTAPTPERAPVLLALARLYLSPLNPRRHVAEADTEALADSIEAVGLMQNLAGHAPEHAPEGDADATAGRVGIVAGGRRLRALARLAERQGADPETVMVPVALATDAAEAEAWAGVENAARAALHPAEEVRAYAAMAERGATPERIARAFAVTVLHVRRRMKLASLPGAILDALAADAITLDVAGAYTVARSPEQAAEAFAALAGTWQGERADYVRLRLVHERADDRDPRARLVGRDAYEAAGGTVTADLFGERVFFEDGALLGRLAEAEIARRAEAVRAEGWRWVDAALARPAWETTSRLARTYPSQPDPAPRDAARYDELAEIVESGEADEGEIEEWNALAERLDVETWSEAQKALAGAFVYLDSDGTVRVDAGFVAASERAEAEAAGIVAPDHRHRAGDTAARAPASGPYTAALAADLATVRTCAVQAALLDKPEVALDLLAFALSTRGYHGAIPLGLAADAPRNAVADDAGLSVPDRLAAPEGWPIDAAQAAEAFAAFRARPKRERNAVLTESVARLFSLGLAGADANPLAEAVATLIVPKPRKVWTPTAGFLKRLKGAQLDAIMAEIEGEGPGRAFAVSKKGAKAARLAAIFSGEATVLADGTPLSPEQRARAAAWLPEGMTPAEAGGAPAVTDEDEGSAPASAAA